MLKLAVRWSERAKNHYIRVGRSRAREVLLRYDDRMLGDLGFSRHALEQGVEAWPWRDDNVDVSVIPEASKIGERQDNVKGLEKQTFAVSNVHSGEALQDADMSRSKVAQTEPDELIPVREHEPNDIKRDAA